MNAGESPMSIDLAREPDFRIGRLEVRPSTREVFAGETRKVLEPRIMQVLVALSRRHGEVVSRDDLIASCWGGRVIGEDAIQRAVAGVRRLGDTHGGFAVETVARVGYRLCETAAGASVRRPRAWRRWSLVAAGLAGLAVVAAGVWLSRDLWGPHPSRAAVLPFDAIAGDPQSRYLANALLDNLLGGLSQNRIQPVSRTDSLALRGAEGASALRRLGVGYVLDGSVERNGAALRVQLHLDDPRAHLTLWSRSFDAPAADADALARRVAVRAALVVGWTVSPKLDPVRNDPAVVAAYVEAQDAFTDGKPRAVDLAREVVARAPRLAAGHALLAAALNGYTIPGSDATTRVSEVTAESDREARRALALDPTDAGPYAHVAANLPFTAWSERERLLLKALAIDPHNGDLAAAYSWFLLNNVGRSREAVDWQKQAMRAQADLADANNHDTLSAELLAAGRIDEAAEVVEETRRLWPDYWELPIADFPVAVARGEYARALALLDGQSASGARPQPQADAWRVALRAALAHDAGRRQAAIRSIVGDDRLDEIARLRLLAFLGDADDAFPTADRVFTPTALTQPASHFLGGTNGIGYLYMPQAASLRRDVRFMALAKRLGLVDYWRTSGRWPDFCSEPGLPYDCKAEAAKLSVVKPRS